MQTSLSLLVLYIYSPYFVCQLYSGTSLAKDEEPLKVNHKHKAKIIKFRPEENASTSLTFWRALEILHHM